MEQGETQLTVRRSCGEAWETQGIKFFILLPTQDVAKQPELSGDDQVVQVFKHLKVGSVSAAYVTAPEESPKSRQLVLPAH